MARALSAVMNFMHFSKTSRQPIFESDVREAIWLASFCSDPVGAGWPDRAFALAGEAAVALTPLVAP